MASKPTPGMRLVFGSQPKGPTLEEKTWKAVSSELFPQVNALKKFIKGYSYLDRSASLLTDEKLCDLLVQGLSAAKKLLFSLSDLCFSLHTGTALLPLTDTMRDEVDIFSDEIKIRHCEWRDIPREFLKKIIRTDLALLKGIRKVMADLDSISSGLLRETTRRRRPLPDDCWQKTGRELKAVRNHVRELAILFKERETLCNIHPITLERTFRKIQEEIREKI